MQGNYSTSKGYVRCVKITYFGINQLNRIHRRCLEVTETSSDDLHSTNKTGNVLI